MKKLSNQYVGLVILFVLLTVISISRCKLFDPADDPPTTQIGDTLWIHDMIGADTLFTEPTLAVGRNGDVYFAVAGGTLYWTHARIRALNATSGVMRWESPIVDHISLSSPIVIGDDGTLYVIGAYRLYAINAATGQFNWVWEVPNELPNPNGPGNLYTYGPIGTLALTDAGNLILGSVGSGVYSRAIYCISPGGTMVWYNPDANGVGIQSNLVIGPGNRIHYYTTVSGKLSLVTLDALIGTILWTMPIQAMSSAGNNLALDTDGTIIASFQQTTSDPFRMYRIHPADGTLLWQSGHECNYNPKLVGPDGLIYQDDNAFAGLATYTPGNASASAHPAGVHANLLGTLLSSANQLLTVRNRDWIPTIHAYSSSGQLDWFVPMSNARDNVMALGDDGILFGVLPDGIFAVQGDHGLADKGWPKRYHDNRNTSNVSN
ncbi:MAG: PQQ-binding-like beta-propeller repeat protein [Saprospiraceae bacterium]|nr:PQQ-binding-like beta-propeller repeat protein [Saprospiraceae bacterium]